MQRKAMTWGEGHRHDGRPLRRNAAFGRLPTKSSGRGKDLLETRPGKGKNCTTLQRTLRREVDGHVETSRSPHRVKHFPMETEGKYRVSKMLQKGKLGEMRWSSLE